MNALELSELQLTRLSEDSQWHALLHMREDEPMLLDSEFLLSKQNFTPRNELNLTVSALTVNYADTLCRFPARSLFILNSLDIPLSLDEFSHCKALYEYIQLVPFEQIDLIFSSEVLSSASSMMGHIFFKGSGTNKNGNQVEHAVSFFTEFETFNPIKVMYNGLLGGMPGYLIVRPYEKELTRYLQKEQRNVFEYPLAFSQHQAMLVQLHIWELKDIDITYYFQSYNCATLSLYVLSVAMPSLKDHELLFTSPADLVKASEAEGLVQSSKIHLSKRWASSALEFDLGAQGASKIRALIYGPSTFEIDDWHALSEIEKEYLAQVIDASTDTMASDSLSDELKAQIANRQSELAINLAKTKNPISSPQDSILTTQYRHIDSRNQLLVSFLPASHYLRSPNPQFMSESQLKIAAGTLSIDLQSNDLKIENFTLYSFTTIAPSTHLNSNLSKSFSIAYEQQRTRNLQQQGFTSISGGFGLSERLHRDVLVYGFIDLGLGIHTSQRLAYTSAKLGLILRLVGDSKLRVEHEAKYANLHENLFHESRFELSKMIKSDISIFVNAEYWQINGSSELQASAGIDWHF